MVRVEVALCCLLFGLPAFAEEIAERRTEAERYKARAFKHWHNNEFKEGIEAMERAYQAVHHPDFLFNIAVAYDKWDKCSDSLRAFARFFAACSPPQCGSLEIGRKAAHKIRIGCEVEVLFETSPPGASIVIDGHPTAVVAPHKTRIPPGTYALTLSQKRVGTFYSEITIPSKRLHRAELTLTETPPVPRVTFVGIEQHTEIRLNGEPIPHDLAADVPLREGYPQVVSIKTAGGTPEVIELAARSGQLFEIDVATLPGSWVKPPAEPTCPEQPITTLVAPSSPVSTWGWISIYAGITGLVVGAVFTVEMTKALDLEEDARNQDAKKTTVESIHDDAKLDATLAYVSYGVGAAGIGVGVLLLLMDDDPPIAPTTSSGNPALRWSF